MCAWLELESRGRRLCASPHALRALPPRHPHPGMTLVVAVAGAVLVLDQVVKWLALHRLPPGAPVPVIDGFFSLTLVMNPGLAFGMLGTIPTGWRWVVAVLSMIAVGVLACLVTLVLVLGGMAVGMVIGSMFGGAVGKLVVSVRFGAVVDFLDFCCAGWHWPVFNVADSAISVGVALLALHMLMVTPAE